MLSRVESAREMKLIGRFAFTFLALALLFGWQAREEARKLGHWNARPIAYAVVAVAFAGLGGFALRQRHARRDDSPL